MACRLRCMRQVGAHCEQSRQESGSASAPRKERESRLLRGLGKFADDIQLRDMLYLRFVRSPYAHAKIVSCRHC